jgi:hypothetical protein
MMIILGLMNIRSFLRSMHIPAPARGNSAFVDSHAYSHSDGSARREAGL